MKNFPERLNVNNKQNFSKYNYTRNLCYLRKQIYELIIKENENDYFELDKFARNYLKNNMTIMLEMTEKIRQELKELGWNTKLSYGGTGLFIYSTENPPTNCYEDGF